MNNARQQIIAACSSGDIGSLEALLKGSDIGPNHPHSVYQLDRSVPESQQLPVVEQMFLEAIKSEQIDVILFLAEYFPGSSLYGHPMRAAIDTGNPNVLRAACKCDPESANVELGDDDTMNALGYAASKPNGAELIKVLLDAGADPNHDPPFKLPACRNVSAAVLAGMPVSTFEQFFDAGYIGHDPFPIEYAVEKQRKDVLKVLFSRCQALPDPQVLSEEKLVDIADEHGDQEMVAMIKGFYASRYHKKGGILARLKKRLHSKSRKV
jgi:hypothetical protein